MLSSKWWEGPSWLKQNSEHWPDGEINCEPQEVNVERKKPKNAMVDLAEDAPPLLLCNVSDYDKMLRIFAWIFRFVNNCRKDSNKCKELELSVAEIENSEKRLIHITQTYYLPDVEFLKFVTFVDVDNILRIKSKITEREDESSFLYPILLPNKNRCSSTTDIDELNSRDFRKRMKYRIKLLSDLRQRFRKAYLTKIIELIPGRDGEIRTVRLKTQYGSVIRPVQRIFPLEIQAIANNDKELKGESISVKCAKPENVLNSNDVLVKKYTSSGRLVKEPKRLDLLNYDCYRKKKIGCYLLSGAQAKKMDQTSRMTQPIQTTRRGRKVKAVQRLNLGF
ncbi:DUF5641 domain-containing protein [Nephila pilipes]|uniref:DUF5641 domain-containing protein n=1 Tax=Nephila pilipes TaxID=299642 RepID=A0A8X6NZ15_NEPPI|nr:DUF5641 domain-containing protein [Nephila pilipes]